MSGCEFCGYANRTAGKYLHVVEHTEPRIFISMHGSGFIQIFDEEYPGFVDGFYLQTGLRYDPWGDVIPLEETESES